MPNNNAKINLLMLIHCHQPVGNFDGIFKEAYDKSYLPFIQVLERHPKIKIALHYSGCLLDWLKDKRPEFLEILKRLVKSGQVEMVTGGYYEPILPLIPDRDKMGQIKMHTDFLRHHTGYQARGIWLTERVWEPYLAKVFSQANLAYTVVDDSHFELTGKKVDEILGYYITEEEGYTTAIFPSSKKLRYSMPFKLPNETIDYLKSVATPDGTRAVTFGDDGEKFGLWPKTYKWVYEEGWLENFFRALEDNLDWINVTTPAQYLDTYGPLGRIYIPCASYPEMLEWSGGYFRNFLVKYTESNWMHKHMLYASDIVNELDTKEAGFKEARQALYKSQCNCAYWHGVFGGLYLHHLRHGIYSNIIEAQRIALDCLKPKQAVRAEVLDIDKDGMDEIALDNGPLGIFIDPCEGGTIVELDYKPKALNLTNTMTRRPEAYHKNISAKNGSSINQSGRADGVPSIHELVGSKQKNLDELLNYDGYRKAFLIEHFLGAGTTIKDFMKAGFEEAGDFVSMPYRYEVKKEAGATTVCLERNGMVYTGDSAITVQLNKGLKVEPKKAGIDISYKLKNMADRDAALWFGTEINVSLMDSEFYKSGELINIDKIEIKDEWFKVFLQFSMSRNTNIWFYPVETVSESEAGFEKTYQQLCFLFHWQVNLKPRQVWASDIALQIK